MRTVISLTIVVVMLTIDLVLAADTGLAEGNGNPKWRCQSVWPAPFPVHHSFLLNDARSGFMLFLESDGRHMAAITHDGNIVWQRNLFDDPKLLTSFPPPPPFPGEKPMSNDEARRWIRSVWQRQYIDRLGVVSDCEAQDINHQLPTKFRGHFVRAGSGTHIYYLIDAKTGDFMVELIN